MSKELVPYKNKLKEQAKELSTLEVGELPFISLRGGLMSLNDIPLPGNQLVGIILDRVVENAYYEGAFDPDNPMPPKCWALGDKPSEMGPPDFSDSPYFEAQADKCVECPKFIFGSSNTGRGKACKEKRRIALLKAGEVKKVKRSYEPFIYDTYEDYEEADILVLRLPVTSLKRFKEYVRSLSQNYGLHPMAFYSLIFVEPHPKYQFQVGFELIGEVPEELYPLLFKRQEEARQLLLQPFQPPIEFD